MLLLSLLLVAASQAPASPAPAAAPTLNLATWNITYLDREADAGRIPRSNADYARLRSYAKALGADLVALQEVDGVAAARRVFDAASWDFHFAADQPNRQGVGFAWRQGLKVTPMPDVRELALNPGLRPGADIRVELGDRRLRVLNVHLKSGCQSGPLFSERSNDCATLRRQLEIVERWMDARAAAEEPFVVMGDFNRALRAYDPAWIALDDAEPPESDLVSPGAEATPRCWNLGWVDFIDHIVFSRTAATWLVPGSFRQVLYHAEDREHMETLSDHCPVVVGVR